ncbi:unnamed protein product [Fusarium graminearum]|nr:unnamed protein product [Fusarium graminearum]
MVVSQRRGGARLEREGTASERLMETGYIHWWPRAAAKGSSIATSRLTVTSVSLVSSAACYGREGGCVYTTETGSLWWWPEAVDGRGACSLKMVVEATPPETVPEDVLPTTDDAVTIEMETDDPVPVSADDDTVDAAPAGPSVAVAAPVELSISNAAPAEPMIVDATPTEKIEMNNTDITVTRDTAMEDPVPICTTDGNVPADDGVDAIDASVTRDVTMEDPEPVAITGGGGVVGTTVQR